MVPLVRRAGAGFIFVVAGLAFAADAPVTPLKNAHAHNDYLHRRPLLDALDQGFCSVEADIFLVDGKLLVGHTLSEVKPGRTLETLYLDPLRERVRADGARVHRDGPPFWLLVDVKSDANSTYAVLHDVLARYSDMLTTVDDGRIDRKAVSVVISGNMARATMAKQARRFSGYDGRAGDVESDVPAHLMPWLSDNWTKLFTWRGEGTMPGPERDKLKDFVARTHAHGRLVRFWNIPDRPAVWAELRTSGVDLINTDRLAELRNYLVKPH